MKPKDSVTRERDRLKSGKTKGTAKDKMADRGPIKFSPKSLWQDLISSGTLGENKGKQSNLAFPSLWKVLSRGKQFTPLKKPQESQVPP